jgi:predicted signal transduction protein with EAL and GGDEF domain
MTAASGGAAQASDTLDKRTSTAPVAHRFADASKGVNDLRMQAEIAMYAANAAGRAMLRCVDRKQQAAVAERAELEAFLASPDRWS